MLNKPKYSIGEVVRLEKPNNKVLLRIERHEGEFENDPMYLCRWIKYPNTTGSYYQWQLKPYRPSRTGKFRNKKGQFITRKRHMILDYIDKNSKEVDKQIDSDSKQSNYQKILRRLDKIEKLIYKLGRIG